MSSFGSDCSCKTPTEICFSHATESSSFEKQRVKCLKATSVRCSIQSTASPQIRWNQSLRLNKPHASFEGASTADSSGSQRAPTHSPGLRRAAVLSLGIPAFIAPGMQNGYRWMMGSSSALRTRNRLSNNSRMRFDKNELANADLTNERQIG